MSPTSDLAAQYVQVEVASPEDQQFIVYTEWKNKNNISFFLWKKMFIKITVSKKKQSAVISHYVESFFWKKIMKLKQRKKIFKKTFLRAKKMEKYKFWKKSNFMDRGAWSSRSTKCQHKQIKPWFWSWSKYWFINHYFWNISKIPSTKLSKSCSSRIKEKNTLKTPNFLLHHYDLNYKETKRTKNYS